MGTRKIIPPSPSEMSAPLFLHLSRSDFHLNLTAPNFDHLSIISSTVRRNSRISASRQSPSSFSALSSADSSLRRRRREGKSAEGKSTEGLEAVRPTTPCLSPENSPPTNPFHPHPS